MMRQSVQTLGLHYGTISLLSLRPHNSEKSTSTVMFFPGWGCGDASEYIPLLAPLVDRGHTVLIPEFNNSTHETHQPETAGLHPTQSRKAWLYGQLLDTVNNQVEAVWLIGYSEGAIHAILAASGVRVRQSICRLSLICPAGLAPIESVPRIIWRAARNAIQTFRTNMSLNPASRHRLAHHRRSVQIYLRQFPGSGASEAMNPGQIEVRERFRKLVTAGRQIDILAAQDDRMIALEPLLSLRQEGRCQVRIIEGSHNVVFTHPKRVIATL